MTASLKQRKVRLMVVASMDMLYVMKYLESSTINLSKNDQDYKKREFVKNAKEYLKFL